MYQETKQIYICLDYFSLITSDFFHVYNFNVWLMIYGLDYFLL